MHRIYLLGVSGPELPAGYGEFLGRCGCVIASSRYRSLLAGFPLEVLPITPVAAALTGIEERLSRMDVAVLASGDPLFYGIGRTLLDAFGRERVEIVPALSAMQLAFARLKEPWEDAVFLSLHGRSVEDIPSRILPHAKVLVFTDREQTPAVVAGRLQAALAELGGEEGMAAWRALVGERLGLPGERVTEGSLAEIMHQEFKEPNVLLLRRRGPLPPAGPLGLTEDELAHSRGLITKDEVRAVALHRLRLPSQGVLWDVGAGSGSVAVEAARLAPGLTVYAVEQEAEQLANLRENIRRWNAYNVRPVSGEAPAVLAGLPAPDRVFVGGSGGRLAAIVETSAARLPVGGRLVVNAVTARTREEAPGLLRSLGLKVEVSEVAVRRRSLQPDGVERETALNPITVVVGEK